jgi:hypothetical protein
MHKGLIEEACEKMSKKTNLGSEYLKQSRIAKAGAN